eukprot:5840123-Amphidinium_carterae.1
MSRGGCLGAGWSGISNAAIAAAAVPLVGTLCPWHLSISSRTIGMGPHLPSTSLCKGSAASRSTHIPGGVLPSRCAFLSSDGWSYVRMTGRAPG